MIPTQFKSNFTSILSFDSHYDYNTVKMITHPKHGSTYIINILSYYINCVLI